MSVRARGEGFQADFTLAGQRYRAQFPTHQEALQWEADARAAIIGGRPLPGAPTGAVASMTIKEAAQRTVERYWRGTKNEEGAQRNVEVAVEFFGANTPVSAITSAKVDEYVGELQRRGQAGGTINRKLAALSKTLRHAVRLGALPAVPSIERRKEGEPRERFLTEPEAQALIDLLAHWGKPEEALLVTFLLDTGARLGEGLALRVADVAEDRVTLGAGGASKTGEWRVVPLTRRLREALGGIKYHQRTDRVFHINRYTFTKLYGRAVDHLKLGDDVVIHTLRHTCASWLVQRGVDLRRVQAWMGHRSIQTTLRYAKLSPTSLFEAVSVLDDKPTNVVPLRRPA